MITLKNVWYHYGVRPVLRDVSFEVGEGELVAVMGPNGMGKSTLLAVMAGILPPLRGSVEVGGQLRRSSPEVETTIRKKVVYLPDDPYLPALSTGRQFLVAVGRLYEIEAMRLIDHMEHLLEVFHLVEQGDAPIHSYSAGQKKKIGLCSALITEAPILILDEPFSGGLDSSALLAMSRILKSLADRRDITVVMAVPVPELVDALAHKVAILVDGQIQACDSPDQVRRMTGDSEDLAQALERMIHPETCQAVDRYLARRPE